MVWIFVAAGIGLAVLGVWWALSLFGAPMWRPGQARPAPVAAAAEPGRFRIGGVELAYRERGEGRPVLLLHGGPGVPFAATWPALDGMAGYRFVYYDQRGCGSSSRPVRKLAGGNMYENMKTLESALGIGAQLADIESIRLALGQEKLIVVGHSFGGFLAALYAAEYPQRVEKLVLVAPASVVRLPAADGGLYESLGRAIRDPAAKAEYELWLKRTFDYPWLLSRDEAGLAEHNGRFLRFAALAEVGGAGAARAGTGGSSAAAAGTSGDGMGGFVVPALYLSLGKSHDWRPALAKIAAPTLIVAGADDAYGPVDEIRSQYAQAIPGARLEVLPGGHFPYAGEPERFRGLVERFLR